MNNNYIILFLKKYLHFGINLNPKPKNHVKKYIENNSNSIKNMRYPVLYSNPIFDPNKKRLIWNNFDVELKKCLNNYHNKKRF